MDVREESRVQKSRSDLLTSGQTNECSPCTGWGERMSRGGFTINAQSRAFVRMQRESMVASAAMACPIDMGDAAPGNKTPLPALDPTDPSFVPYRGLVVSGVMTATTGALVGRALRL